MIRKFVPEDREDYIRFSTEFYNSSAVDKPVPREHFEQGFDEMMGLTCMCRVICSFVTAIMLATVLQ